MTDQFTGGHGIEAPAHDGLVNSAAGDFEIRIDSRQGLLLAGILGCLAVFWQSSGGCCGSSGNCQRAAGDSAGVWHGMDLWDCVVWQRRMCGGQV